MKAYCKDLIEVCGKDGGFVLTSGAGGHKGNPDNVRAIVEAVKEYGVYK
jgi:uroporphyrinogen-III decarboxylase